MTRIGSIILQHLHTGNPPKRFWTLSSSCESEPGKCISGRTRPNRLLESELWKMYENHEPSHLQKLFHWSKRLCFQVRQIPIRPEVLDVCPKRVLHRCRSQAPFVPFKAELIDKVKPKHNAKQVAPENIDDDVVPPTLFEVVEGISQGIFDEFECDRGE